MKTLRQRAKSFPHTLITDRAVVLLVTSRRNMLLRFNAIRTRCNSNHPHRSKIDKARTNERRDIANTLRYVERDLMTFIAEATHHPDLWTNPKLPARNDGSLKPMDDATLSLRERLKRSWHVSHRKPNFYRSLDRAEKMRAKTVRRHALARELQALDEHWLSALTLAVFPDDELPPQRVIHPTRYKP